MNVSYGTYQMLGGSLDRKSYKPIALKALGIMKGTIGHNKVTDYNRKAYQEAFTALVNRLGDPGEALVSERVGDTSLSVAANVGGKSLTDKEFVAGYLSGSGLLYRGI